MTGHATPGIVSKLPVHDGDGYSWGGDVIVTFGERSVNLGTSQNYSKVQEIEGLARLIAAAPELLEAAIMLASLDDKGRAFPTQEQCNFARAAIAKARGEAPPQSMKGKDHGVRA